MFLVGGLVVFGLACILVLHGGTVNIPNQLKALLQAGGAGFFAVAGGLLILPITALAGAVCEGLTDLCIRRLIKLISKDPGLIMLAGQSKVAVSHDFWRNRFQEAAKQSKALEGFPLDEGRLHGLAVGLMYDSEQEESISWGTSHYSTYILVSNFAFLAIVAEVYFLISGFSGWTDWRSVGWATIALAFVFYPCLSLSLDRYLYSYEVAFRQAAIELLREKHDKNAPDTGGTPV